MNSCLLTYIIFLGIITTIVILSIIFPKKKK